MIPLTRAALRRGLPSALRMLIRLAWRESFRSTLRKRLRSVLRMLLTLPPARRTEPEKSLGGESNIRTRFVVFLHQTRTTREENEARKANRRIDGPIDTLTC